MIVSQTSANSVRFGQFQLDLAQFADGLECDQDGVWRGQDAQPVSYPATGHDSCYAIEDGSFWFAHRNACLLALLKQFRTPGPLFDIGGGNGFVAMTLQSRGNIPVVLVEPVANGVRNARSRGLTNVVQATLKAARFRPGSLPAMGFFDVLEHIKDEQEFLSEARQCLAKGGRIFITVPAGRWLWSEADVQAGHFRRYTLTGLRRVLEQAGFRLLFMSKIFSPLPLPLFLSRSLPSLVRWRCHVSKDYSPQHQLESWSWMNWLWRWEESRLAGRRTLPCGTSCLAVAESTLG